MFVQTDIADPFYSTRIVAIGDSLTKDTTSTNLNGYRGAVSATLTTLTWLGSVSSGGSLCEGWPGERIEEISDRMLLMFRTIPSIGITVSMLGTNNAAQGQSGSVAVGHYTDYLDRMVGMSPYTRNIVLSTPNTNTGAGPGQACIDAINNALPSLCAARPRCTFVDIRPDIAGAVAPYVDTYHLAQSAYTAMAPTIIAAIQALA